jgi:hypothetical protein
VYVCAGAAAVEVPPSPKVQAYVMGCGPASGSKVPMLLNCTFSGLGPWVGVAPLSATGGWLPPPVKAMRYTVPSSSTGGLYETPIVSV